MTKKTAIQVQIQIESDLVTTLLLIDFDQPLPRFFGLLQNEQKVGVDEMDGVDTLYTVLTTRAPAVLKINY